MIGLSKAQKQTGHDFAHAPSKKIMNYRFISRESCISCFFIVHNDYVSGQNDE